MQGAEATQTRKGRADAEASQQFSAAALHALSARSTHAFPFVAFETRN